MPDSANASKSRIDLGGLLICHEMGLLAYVHESSSYEKAHFWCVVAYCAVSEDAVQLS